MPRGLAGAAAARRQTETAEASRAAFRCRETLGWVRDGFLGWVRDGFLG
jgi:hypothetical protein